MQHYADKIMFYAEEPSKDVENMLMDRVKKFVGKKEKIALLNVCVSAQDCDDDSRRRTLLREHKTT